MNSAALFKLRVGAWFLRNFAIEDVDLAGGQQLHQHIFALLHAAFVQHIPIRSGSQQ
jgi:hypothetical protein